MLYKNHEKNKLLKFLLMINKSGCIRLYDAQNED